MSRRADGACQRSYGLIAYPSAGGLEQLDWPERGPGSG